MECTGFITPNALYAILKHIQRVDNDIDDQDHDDQIADIQDILPFITHNEDRDKRISFNAFLEIIERKCPREIPEEGHDPRVIQFLHILEEYRISCDAKGNYLEAQRAKKQLDTLAENEVKRQIHAIHARQANEKIKMHIAHKEQFKAFNTKWDNYLTEFDETSRSYVEKMMEHHTRKLKKFQEKLHQEMLSKPPKWSRELLEWRKRQHILAKQKNYSEAQKIKAISDALEHEERTSMNTSHAGSVARKEANLRQQQKAEVNALLKRIDIRRSEHLKKRKTDCKRLLQRNQNIQKSLDSKQAAESAKLSQDIKNNMVNELKSIKSRVCIGEGGVKEKKGGERKNKKLREKRKPV